jgi:hypothetical protein
MHFDLCTAKSGGHDLRNCGASRGTVIGVNDEAVLNQERHDRFSGRLLSLKAFIGPKLPLYQMSPPPSFARLA